LLKNSRSLASLLQAKNHGLSKVLGVSKKSFLGRAKLLMAITSSILVAFEKMIRALNLYKE